MRYLAIPLALLSTTTVVAAQSVEDFLDGYLPSCLMNCTVQAIETDTSCGDGSVASTDSNDISCLCDALLSTDEDLARRFTESMTSCVEEAPCSDAEFVEFSQIDPLDLLRGSQDLCGDVGTEDNDSDDDSDDDSMPSPSA
ncbi:hypothetical protein BDW62DRAFT_181739 [Aspergillus aurantiobrunneus]